MNKLISIIVLIAALAAAFFAFNHYIYTEKQGNGLPTDPYRATLTGEQVCLPHKDTTGPQTLECAIGLKTEVGEYYALDFSLMSQTPPVLQNGDRITANGLVTPIENLSSDHWQKYDVEGIFSVTDTVFILD